MDALEAMAERHSTRQYSGQPVVEETIKKVVDAGRMAPTARNEQPWEFIVVTEPQRLKEIADFTDYGRFIAQAGACIAVFCKDTKYYLEDGCAATTNMLVAATALGLKSCWVAGDKKPYGPKIAYFLGVPNIYKLVSLVVVGYYEGQEARAHKRDLKDVLHWNKYR